MNTHEYEINTDYVLYPFEQRVNTLAHTSSSGSKDERTWEDHGEFDREAAHTRRRRSRERPSKSIDKEGRRGRVSEAELSDESVSSDYYSDTPAYRVRNSEERRRRRSKKEHRPRREGKKKRKVA